MATRPEITGRAALSISEFCRAYGLSRSGYHNLRKHGLGPDEMHAGKRVLITTEAQRKWQRQRTVKAEDCHKARAISLDVLA